MSRAARAIVRAEISRAALLRSRLAEVEVPRNRRVRSEFRYRQLLAAAGRLERFVQSAEHLQLDLGPQRKRATRELRLLEAILRDTAEADWQSIEDAIWPVRVPGIEARGSAVDEVLEAVFDVEDAEDGLRFAQPRNMRAPRASSGAVSNWNADALTAAHRRELSGHLQQYRRRCLFYGEARRAFHSLWRELDLMNHIRIDSLVGALRDQLGVDALEHAIGLLRALSGLAGELGFDGLVDALLDGSLSSDALPGGGMNVIPGEDAGACQNVVLALSRAEGRKLKLPTVLGKLRTHLIHCRGTDLALVFTDSWDARLFDREHRDDWRAFHGHGVNFAVILVDPGSGTFSSVPIDLS